MSLGHRTSSTRVVTAGCFFALFLFGFEDNLKGPTLPLLLRDLDFTYSSGGTILLGGALGFLTSVLLTGALSDIIGKKPLIFVAAVALLIGIAIYTGFSSFWTLFLGMIVIGFGFGSLEIGGNGIVVDIHHEEKGKYLNLLAFSYGAGAIFASLFAGWLVAGGFGWRGVYRLSVIPVVLLTIYFLFVKYTENKPSTAGGLDFRKIGRSAFSWRMMTLYFLMSSSSAIETSMSSWIVEFLQKVKYQSVLQSSTFLSLFFAFLTAGRLFGIFLVERIGYIRIMLYASFASVVCVSVGTFGPVETVFLLPLTGLFISIMFPTITATVSDLHSQNVGTVLGLLFSFAGLGAMLGPWAVGVFSDFLGIHLGFGVNLVFCVAMVILLTMLFLTREKTEAQKAA